MHRVLREDTMSGETYSLRYVTLIALVNPGVFVDAGTLQAGSMLVYMLPIQEAAMLVLNDGTLCLLVLDACTPHGQ
jgi:hypothetical protein